MSAKQKYHIKRTGRRCTRFKFTESDGTIRWLNAIGAHCWDLTAADAAKIADLPDTRVRMIKPKPAPPNDPVKTKKKAKKKAKK